MQQAIRSWYGRRLWVALAILMLVGGLACFPQAEAEPRAPITASVLDAIDAAVQKRGWPDWSMEITGNGLAFLVEVALMPPAEVCRGIDEVVRSTGEDIVWTAELTRGGRPIARCSSHDLIALGGVEPVSIAGGASVPGRS